MFGPLHGLSANPLSNLLGYTSVLFLWREVIRYAWEYLFKNKGVSERWPSCCLTSKVWFILKQSLESRPQLPTGKEGKVRRWRRSTFPISHVSDQSSVFFPMGNVTSVSLFPSSEIVGKTSPSFPFIPLESKIASWKISAFGSFPPGKTYVSHTNIACGLVQTAELPENFTKDVWHFCMNGILFKFSFQIIKY